MSWDVDDVLDEIVKAIASTLRELEQGKVVKTRTVYGDDHSIKVTTSVSVGPAIPESVPLVPPLREPLIEVFEGDNILRVLVELPGVKKEDVRVLFLDGVLRIEVSKAGRIHRRDVACKVAPGSVDVKSTTENNSVVELTFVRKRRGEGR